MIAPHHPKVIFLRVTDNQTKLRRICTTLQSHFDCKEKVILILPNQGAAQYVDAMLWKIPEENFLPHTQTIECSDDLIVLTYKQKNLNNAKILFNLCAEPIPIYDQFERIYELLDETNASKSEISHKKMTAYANMGLPVS